MEIRLPERLYSMLSGCLKDINSKEVVSVTFALRTHILSLWYRCIKATTGYAMCLVVLERKRGQP